METGIIILIIILAALALGLIAYISYRYLMPRAREMYHGSMTHPHHHHPHPHHPHHHHDSPASHLIHKMQKAKTHSNKAINNIQQAKHHLTKAQMHAS